MFKKIFFLCIFLNIFTCSIYSSSFKVIALVDNIPITHIDLENEIKILSILNSKKISKNFNNIALNNLIEEALKNKEIKKENLEINDNLINQYFSILIKNLNLNINQIDQNLILLIKKKIMTDKLWNSLVLKKYGWKISVNMNEIDQKIINNYKNTNIPIEKERENLILEEKNKKLAVFSKYHLNILKKQSLIKTF